MGDDEDAEDDNSESNDDSNDDSNSDNNNDDISNDSNDCAMTVSPAVLEAEAQYNNSNNDKNPEYLAESSNPQGILEFSINTKKKIPTLECVEIDQDSGQMQ